MTSEISHGRELPGRRVELLDERRVVGRPDAAGEWFVDRTVILPSAIALRWPMGRVRRTVSGALYDRRGSRTNAPPEGDGWAVARVSRRGLVVWPGGRAGGTGHGRLRPPRPRS